VEAGWFPARKLGHPNGGFCEAEGENDADDEGEEIWERLRCVGLGVILLQSMEIDMDIRGH
jgi:hypothetical protein